MTLHFSARQAKYYHESEGAFLRVMLAVASQFLPAILAGLAAGLAEYHTEGNEMFWGRRDHTFQIRHSGVGLVLAPAEHSKLQGFYVKLGDKVFQGKDGLFYKILLLNILF